MNLMGDDKTTKRCHMLKSWPEYFDAVQRGEKTFEVRRADRDFRVGDVLCLQRWEPDREDYTRDGSGYPATETVRVSYVLPGGQFGIEPGFVVMGVHRG
jgi:hypothetical protein